MSKNPNAVKLDSKIQQQSNVIHMLMKHIKWELLLSNEISFLNSDTLAKTVSLWGTKSTDNN